MIPSMILLVLITETLEFSPTPLLKVLTEVNNDGLISKSTVEYLSSLTSVQHLIPWTSLSFLIPSIADGFNFKPMK